MNRQQILKTVTEIFSIMTDAEEILETSDLVEDLGISSMDILTMMSNLEEEFGIRITERSIRKIETVGDIVDFVEQALGA